MNDNLALELSGVYLTYPISKQSPKSIRKLFSFFQGKRQSPVATLSDINFSINKGEVIGILGHNGAGKSTLLRLLSGIYQPDKGEVKVNGEIKWNI